ncbi:MAG: hypothetical protein A2234_04110 [Elusimicrobia bacterium RIFOXYA2_FULL_58_8]|nr:MAG: hypothetical protein A2285_08130 [Elusimicrobia bacterium RIFOXYA12_FULL_57_11]OGS15458.1 MAG: hypothetical protein A2234_04110 [Elusimicrobia bacterium RIFOXYA2_FULL_58_8]
MNILLTGGTGFLGSRLLTALAQKGHRVVVLTTKASKLTVPAGCTGRVAALTLEKINLDKVFSQEKIEAVIHLATVYGRKKETLAELLQCNVTLPIRLMELSLRHGVKLFLNTDTFYSKKGQPYQPLRQYSLSKIQCLQRLRKMAGTTRVINLRLEHLYGPGDATSKFIPGVIQRMLQDESGAIEFTSGIQKRDFIFIDDAVKAYLSVLRKPESFPGPFAEIEVGTGKGYTVKALVNVIRAIIRPVRTRCAFGAKPLPAGEIMNSRAKAGLLLAAGWRPSRTLRQGLRKTISSMRKDARQ